MNASASVGGYQVNPSQVMPLWRGDPVVYPYLGTGDPPRTIRMIPVSFDPTDVAAADAVFATHEHTDHAHGPSRASQRDWKLPQIEISRVRF